MIIKENINLICIEDFDSNEIPDGLTITKQQKEEFLTQQIEEQQSMEKMNDDSDEEMDDLV